MSTEPDETDDAELNTNQFEAEVPAETLELVAKALDAVGDEATLAFTEDTLSASTSDFADVLGVNTGTHEIATNQSASIAVDTEEFAEAVDDALFFSVEDTLSLQFADDATLEIFDDEYPTAYSLVDVLDASAVSDPPEIDAIGDRCSFAVDVEVPAWEFLGALQKVRTPTDGVLKLTPEDGILIEGKQTVSDADTHTKTVHWPYRDSVDADTGSIDSPSEVVCLASPQFVGDLVDALPTEGTVTVQFGDVLPLYVQSSEGPSALLAPRQPAGTPEQEGEQ